MTLTIHQLQVFATVVESGSFTRAAATLFLTQPAVTFQVRQLEKEIGKPLFVRDGRGVVATAVGFAVYRYACEVLASTDGLHREVEAIASSEIEHIVAGAGPAYSTYVLPELVARFHRRHSRLRLSLVQTPASAAAILQQVRSGQIDIGLVLSSRPLDDAGVTQVGFDEPLIVESAIGPISAGKSLTLADLAQAPFIRTPPGLAQLSMRLDQLLLGAGLGPPNLVIEISTWDGVKEAVRAGIGMAVTLWAVVRHEVENGQFRVVAVEGYHDPHGVYLVTRPEPRHSPISTTFRELKAFLTAEVPRSLHCTVGTESHFPLSRPS